MSGIYTVVARGKWKFFQLKIIPILLKKNKVPKNEHCEQAGSAMTRNKKRRVNVRMCVSSIDPSALLLIGMLVIS